MPGNLLHYDQETGDTLWFVSLPGSPSEPGWFGAPGGEIVPGSPVVFVPGPRQPSQSVQLTTPVHYGVGSGKGKGAAAFAELEAYSRRLGASSSASPTRTTTRPKSGGKREAPSKKGSQRASGDAKHRRGDCPEGHYWSFKHQKCLRSNF